MVSKCSELSYRDHLIKLRLVDSQPCFICVVSSRIWLSVYMWALMSLNLRSVTYFSIDMRCIHFSSAISLSKLSVTMSFGNALESASAMYISEPFLPTSSMSYPCNCNIMRCSLDGA